MFIEDAKEPLAPGKSPRVAFLLSSLGPGGVTKMVTGVANLTNNQVSNCVDVLSLTGYEYESVGLNPDIRLFRMGYRRVFNSLLAVIGYMRKNKPDIVIASVQNVNVVAVLAQTFLCRKARLVIWEHGVLEEDPQIILGARSRIVEFLARLLYRRANVLICVSETVLKSLERARVKPPKEVAIVPNFIHTNLTVKSLSPAPKPPKEPFILGIGRLSFEKGFDLLLEAFSRLELGPPKLVLLGDGPEFSALRQKCVDLGIADRVQFFGHVENPLEFLKKCEIFVLPSRREGFPLVLLEALQTGARIIATDCPGGVRELLGSGTFGRLVSPNESGSLAQAIEAEVKNPYRNTREKKLRAAEFHPSRIFPYFREAVFD